MSDDPPTTGVQPAFPDGCAAVTDLATRRRNGDVLRSITLVFGGVNYGTFSVSTPYTKGKPLALYVVPQEDDPGGDVLAGPLDCLVTDDLTLAAELRAAR